MVRITFIKKTLFTIFFPNFFFRLYPVDKTRTDDINGEAVTEIDLKNKKKK